jgi:ankyrin repeat protein
MYNKIKSVLILLVVVQSFLFAQWTPKEKELLFDLERYAYIGDIQKIKQLTKNRYVPKVMLSNALLKAGYKNREDIIKYLLSLGADINQESYSGRNILSYAVQNNNLKLVKYLLKNNAQMVRSNDGYDLFFSAVERANTAMFRFLLPYCKDLQRYYYVEGNFGRDVKTTLLLSALQHNALEIAQLLVESGVDIQQKNNRGETPLLASMRNKHYKFAKYLIQKGADTSVVDIQGNSVVSYAMQDKQTFLALEALKNKKFNIHQWVETKVFKGEHPLYQYYVQQSKDEWKIYNLLHMAAFHNMPQVVQILLLKGLKSDILDKGKKLRLDALGLAVLNGSKQSIKLLMQKGASPYVVYKNANPEGYYGVYYYGLLANSYTLLSLATITQQKDDNLIREIKDLPQSKTIYVDNATKYFYLYLLSMRDAKGKESIYDEVILFLEKHNFPNYKELQSYYEKTKKPKTIAVQRKAPKITTLFSALLYKRYDLLEELLKSGANPNETKYGKTPAQEAAWGIKDSQQLLEVLKLLKKYGADLNLCQKSGYEYRRTPLLRYLGNNEIDKGIVKELVQMGATLGDDTYALRKVYTIYGYLRFIYIVNDPLFTKQLQTLYDNATKEELSDLVLEIYNNKHISNKRIEKLLEYVYWNKKDLDYERILKNIKKKDKIYTKVSYYRIVN